ncbi:thio(seleno)oxazole modification radical SAM maturase SbtM [Desulfonatronovibrio hydrogenovorans]|uniref:thio(seleno)oxazole modification radical SAM maturase SbtM n=1 Tax=Desulfonatronovibrio hydrogenovorans TaxID=53245 RepID=UPI00048D5094|nr:thio(seleno)oxazole modification radical SAM maturase SbtM [Desulfonatronovibrio hydrogenovorans]
MPDKNTLETACPSCRAILGQDAWSQVCARYLLDSPDDFPDFLDQLETLPPGLAFIPDLARLELAVARIAECIPAEPVGSHDVNTCLELLDLDWSGLCSLVKNRNREKTSPPRNIKEKVLVWKQGDEILFRPATANDLLALKLVLENINISEAAKIANRPSSYIWPVINEARRNGILVGEKTRIARDPEVFEVKSHLAPKYQQADVFTLQWHITQACDLNCKHCYGRESRNHLDLDSALRILDEFQHFCKNKNVHGQVSLTGGNPLLHPDLETIHAAASGMGFTVGILGNPTSEDQLKKLLKKGPISFFQVSLEGQEEHNDYIRGQGHYKKVLGFLDVLKKLDIYSMVMLTLTRANAGQVLCLAREIQDRADLFTFNRLSMVGSGAHLTPAGQDEFNELLADYQEQARTMSVMGFKDNLLNLFRFRHGRQLFGGCTGYGCGAAFNFVSVLCDGEVHACRKFPSRLGSIYDNSLEQIYDSQVAAKYRKGSKGCVGCAIRHVCGGCLAVTYSHGLDIFQDRDPYCWMNQSQEKFR